MKSELLIIVPAYNEEKSIVSTIEGIRASCPEFDYIVIDDGSKDSTAALCRRHGYPIISLPVNLGLTGAFRTGMKYAYRKGYDYAVQVDGDGQHDPSCIRPMLEKAKEGYSIVIGSRYIDTKQKASMRRAGSSIIRGIIRLRTGKKLTDPTSGMRLYDKRLITAFVSRSYMTPEPDTLMQALLRGITFAEVPIPAVDRAYGKSYLTAGASVKYMAKIIFSLYIYPKL